MPPNATTPTGGSTLAAWPAERAWAVLNRGMPYVICDTDGRPVNHDEAKAIIATHWTVPAEVRARRHKKMGKAPQQVRLARPTRARSASGGR